MGSTDRPPWNAEDDEHLRLCHANKMTVSQIAKETGWSTATISRKAKRLNLDWLHAEKTAKAISVNRMSNLEKRTHLETLLWEAAIDMMDQLKQPFMAFSFGGKDNDYNSHQFERPTDTAQKNIMSAVGIATDKAARLADINTSAGDMSDIDLWLANLTMNERAKDAGSGAPNEHPVNPAAVPGLDPLDASQPLPSTGDTGGL